MRGFKTETGFLVLIAAAGLRAQPPTAYSVIEINSMFGTPVTLTIYRDGSRAVVDRATGTRSFFDLQTHKSYSWTVGAAECGSATFSGDWGDPFASSTDMTSELAKMQAKEAGTEVVNGLSTKIYKFAMPAGGGDGTVWLDPKTGLLVKWVLAAPNSAPKTMIERKQLKIGPPPAAIFDLPGSCKAAADAPRVPTEAERIAVETGGNAADFVNAITAPPSRNTCTVLFRIVRAGTMQPIATGIQVAIDLTLDIEHPPHYVIGLGDRATFAGGGLHEVTAQLQNGVLRIDNAPQYFTLDIFLGKGGDSSAMIHRQCAAAQSVLLYVVKNPDQPSEGGDWLWVKSGKFSTVPPPAR
jgi:hypothetical protein